MHTKNFKTKTLFMERKNGDLPDVWPIAIDIGYSSVKTFSPNSMSVFPSYAKEFSGKDTVGVLPDEYITYRDAKTGEAWLVGQYAQEDTSVNEPIESDDAVFSRSRYYAPMFKVIAECGLGSALASNIYGTPSGKKIHVQTGLPVSYIEGREDVEALKEVLAGHHDFYLKIGNKPEERFTFTVEYENVYVIKQPMGTLFSVSVDNEHRFVAESGNYLNKNVLIFDPGFGTLDIVPIQNHQVKKGQTFSNLGMRQVFADTASAIKEKYGIDINVSTLQKHLDDGKITCYSRKTWTSEERDFDDLLQKANREICLKAIEKTAQVFPLDEFDYLIITGGAGAAWGPMIRDRLKGMQTLTIVSGNQNDPLPFVFANVRGYYQLRYMKLMSPTGAANA